MFSCRKNCDAVFKHKTNRTTHEKHKCEIYGGDIDKRNKIEFKQACEASKKIDGTLLHAAKIFESLMAIPKEHRQNGSSNSIVITRTTQDALITDQNPVPSVVNNYNIQITQNTQNLNAVIADSDSLQNIRQQMKHKGNSTAKKVDEEMTQILSLLANERISTANQVHEHIKDRVFTFDEIKECIEDDKDQSMMRREIDQIIKKIISETTNSADMVDAEGEAHVVDEIKNGPTDCIWSMYQKLFLQVQTGGKIQLAELSRRNTRLSSKTETSCEILAFDTIDGRENTEHVIWVKRHWDLLIKELIFAIGNRIYIVVEDYHLGPDRCHPFANWWKKITSQDNLIKDADGINLIKKITNALVQDCKDNLITGWHKLIECCSKLHFQSLPPPDEMKQILLKETQDEYENNKKVMSELSEKFTKTKVYDAEMHEAFTEHQRLEAVLSRDQNELMDSHQSYRNNLINNFLLNGIKVQDYQG